MSEPPSHPPPLDYEPAPVEETNFDRAFAEVIGLEGGYVHDPADYGGETNWGISKRSYPEIDIKNLTERGAKAIYLRDYWNRMRLSEVDDYDIAMEVFEQGVNLGRNRAVTNLQKSINLVSDDDVEVDGVIGPETLAAVNKIGGTDKKSALLKCLNGFQWEQYRDLMEDDSSQRKFFVGWLKRIA